MNPSRNKGPETFDVIVIGSGSAGTAAVEEAFEAGAKRVAVIEARERLGGECPNRACVPTKALLRSVEVLTLARRAKEFALNASKPTFVFSALMRRKQSIVDQLTGGGRIESLLKTLGATLIRGHARFVGERELEIAGKRYAAAKIIIATGSETFVPPVPGLKETGFITSDDAASMKKLPKSLVIIGGGPIGVEWSQILVPLGVKTTMVEFMPKLLPREDAEIAAIVEASFRKQKIKFMTATKVVSVAKSGRGVRVTVECASLKLALSAEAVMVAAGKRPAVGGLDLGKAGITIDKRGAPVLNEYLQTSNPAVYVAGDAAGQMLFTHVAHYHGEVAATNAVKGNIKKSDTSVVPRGTFCSPEVGSVGMTEKEARDRGHDVGVGKVPYAYFGKALVAGEMEGLVKIVADKSTKKVLGGHVVGQAAAEIVHEIALAMYADIPYTKIAEMIHAYPTYAEAVGAAAYGVE